MEEKQKRAAGLEHQRDLLEAAKAAIDTEIRNLSST